MPQKPKRTCKSTRKLAPKKSGGPKIQTQPWEEIVGVFFGTHSMEAAMAIAHWVHTPDCSPDARELIREALKLDGSTKTNKRIQTLFQCTTCCEAGRLAKDGNWIPCPDCKPTAKNS